MPKIGNMSPARKQPDTATYSGRFAVRLRTLREKAGMTVDELAEKSGIPALTLYRWERANRTPSFEELPKISDALEVTVRTLMPPK